MADHATARGGRATAAKSRGTAPKGRARPGRAARTGRPPLRVVRPAPRRDPLQHTRRSLAFLLLPTAVLTIVGIVEVLSASSVSAYEQLGSSFFFFNRQVVYAAIGIVALVLCARMPYRVWQRCSVPVLGVAIVLMLLALHPSSGASAYGASRWIIIGPITLQPSELAKLGLIAFTASVLVRKWNHLDEPAHLALPIAPVVAVVAGIVIMQRDLGTTIILCGSVFMVLFAAGVRLRYLAVTGFAGLAAAAALVFGESYRRERLLAAFDPLKDPLGAGYQVLQGYIALGSGGWWGVGLGASRQKWQYVPNAHTDFIFAILGEELGLVGEIVVLSMFVLVVYAGIRIAMSAPDVFGRLLAVGITCWIGLQAVVNLGAVTGLLPVTGVPLPFVSFGGSALVVSLAAIGILASIARTGATKGGPHRRKVHS
jgi:cell division protein FtsW